MVADEINSSQELYMLGILTAAKRVLSGQHAADSRRRWQELGDKAFGQSD
jgi:hypothetical protein